MSCKYEQNQFSAIQIKQPSIKAVQMGGSNSYSPRMQRRCRVEVVQCDRARLRWPSFIAVPLTIGTIMKVLSISGRHMCAVTRTHFLQVEQLLMISPFLV